VVSGYAVPKETLEPASDRRKPSHIEARRLNTSPSVDARWHDSCVTVDADAQGLDHRREILHDRTERLTFCIHLRDPLFDSRGRRRAASRSAGITLRAKKEAERCRLSLPLHQNWVGGFREMADLTTSRKPHKSQQTCSLASLSDEREPVANDAQFS
jgi:hypothetical protein